MKSKTSFMFRHREWLSLLDLKNKVVLDISQDHLSALYALKNGAKVTVAKTSEEELKTIEDELGGKGYTKAYLADLSFDFKNKFDIIIISDLSEFFRVNNVQREEQARLLARLNGILKDDGILIFGVANKFSIHYKTGPENSKGPSLLSQMSSQFFYKENEVKDLLRAGGFDNIKLFAAYPNSEHCIRFSSYPPNLSLCFPGYSPTIFNVKMQMLYFLERINLTKYFTPSFIVLVKKNA